VLDKAIISYNALFGTQFLLEVVVMSKVMIEVEEDAVEVLDELIHRLYSNRHWWRMYPDYDGWINNEECDKERAQGAKKVAKAFGLYPYNLKDVRNP